MFQTIEDVYNSVLGTAKPSGAIDYSNITLIQIAAIILNLVMAIAFAISIITVSYSALIYIMSAGDPDRTKKAWKTFIYSVTGAAVALGALALKRIILQAMGVDPSQVI